MNTKKQDHDDEHAEAVKTPPKAEVKAAPRAEAPAQPFPYTVSINEPQTVSLPVPEGVKVPVPSISSLDPDTCVLGDPDFTLYVSGENFFADSVIVFAGQNEPTTLGEDGRLSTGVNMAMWHGPDVVKVSVANGPEKSNEVDFTFSEAPAARKKGK